MKKLITTIILISFLFTSNLYAATPLKAGECTEEDGILLTLEEDAQVKKDLIDLDVYKETYKFQEKRADLFKDAYDDVLKENEKLRKSKKWEKWVWLGLGIVITGTAVWGASQLK